MVGLILIAILLVALFVYLYISNDIPNRSGVYRSMPCNTSARPAAGGTGTGQKSLLCLQFLLNLLKFLVDIFKRGIV